MKKIIFILALFISFSSCKSSKRSKRSSNSSSKIITKKSDANENGRVVISSEEKKYTPRNANSRRTKADNIIEYAESFEGVRYKWGGTTKAGMDCSGLIYESFRAYDVNLPRISRDMAKRGDKINLKDVHKGDLLFFKTGNRRNAINHVGLIVSIENNDIEFIHATSSKGVMTSWINETYWHKAFYEARRIL
ncbi:Cell wall-associated hydrolase, NlpC family [Algibacter lectus]|uniref:C40 family peptidase n=1 Tax=Algibacter lectus TaxID=221126 RepID=UPI0008EFC282|nr:C40 family peptidase [Algibacter lectus]SFD38054.1 Cell wall-associated hydrolase, NlpC family [Algibacter lectus]